MSEEYYCARCGAPAPAGGVGGSGLCAECWEPEDLEAEWNEYSDKWELEYYDE